MSHTGAEPRLAGGFLSSHTGILVLVLTSDVGLHLKDMDFCLAQKMHDLLSSTLFLQRFMAVHTVQDYSWLYMLYRIIVFRGLRPDLITHFCVYLGPGSAFVFILGSLT